MHLLVSVGSLHWRIVIDIVYVDKFFVISVSAPR